MANDRLETIQLLFQNRNARARGPTSSANINDNSNEVSNDLTQVNSQWNNRLVPLTDGLPNGSPDSDVDAFTYGLHGRHVYLNGDATASLFPTYYNSAKNRPNTIYEQILNVYQAIDTLEESLTNLITSDVPTASQIGIADESNLYTATNVESALAEVKAIADAVSALDLSAVAQNYIPTTDNTYTLGTISRTLSDAYLGTLDLKEGTVPSSDSNYGKIFVKSSDSRPYFLDSSGLEHELLSSGIQTSTSSTDNAIVRWDGTGADALQNSSVLVEDTTGRIYRSSDPLYLGGSYTAVSGVVGSVAIGKDASNISLEVAGKSFFGNDMDLTGQLTIYGSDDESQLVVRKSSGQTNNSPAILIKDNDGTSLTSIHSDSDSNLFMGIGAGENVSSSNNILIGKDAGNAITTYGSTIAIGHEAFQYNSGLSANIGIGYQAGRSSPGQGFYAICIGYRAGYNLETGGNYNLFLGNNAGIQTTTGSYNTFLGHTETGASNTTGTANVAIGPNAMQYSQTGNSNVCVGNGSGRGSSGNSYSHSVFVGSGSGNKSATGGNNVGVGSSALSLITTGQYNTSVGSFSLPGIDSSSYTTALGCQAGYRLVDSSDYNVYIGYRSGCNVSNTHTGTRNTVIGASTISANTADSNSDNTILGYRAGYRIRTGSENILIGSQTGDNLESGSNNILIGYDLDATYSGIDNELNIGNIITGDTSSGLLQFNADITDQVRIYGSDDETQLIVRKNSTQASSNPPILLEDSDGNDILGIDGIYVSGDQTSFFIGLGAGENITSNNNLLIGHKAGNLNIDGGGNTAIGQRAFRYSGTTSYNNTCVGFQAGQGSTGNSFYSSTVVGYRAGFNLQTGHSSVMIGAGAGQATTTGNSITFVGASAGISNTTGIGNIAIGQNSLQLSQTGHYNLCIGNGAGKGSSGNSWSYNMFIGHSSGNVLETGTSNLCIGGNSFRYKTGGTGNVAIGDSTLEATGETDYNVCIGYQAGYNLATGSDNNVHIGYRSGYHVSQSQIGIRNTAVGFETMAIHNGGTSQDNVVLGYRAGYKITTGDENILIGSLTGDNLEGGSGNIIIGYDLDATTSGVDYELNIGDLILGDLDAGTVNIDGTLSVSNREVDTFDITAEVNSHTASPDELVRCNTGGGSVTITIPEASAANAGHQIVIKDVDGNAFINNIIINRSGSDEIDGETNQTINQNYGSMTLVSYGAGNGWGII